MFSAKVRPAFILLIAMFCAPMIGAGIDLYTPSFIAIAHNLHTTQEAVRLTLVTYLLGYSLGQLFFGPLADRYGRRPVLLCGLLAYTLTSLFAAWATSIDALILLRLAQ